MKNYVTQIEFMRQEAMLIGGHTNGNQATIVSSEQINPPTDNRMHVSDDDAGHNVSLHVAERGGNGDGDGDEESYYGDSDSESIDDSDESSSVTTHDAVDELVIDTEPLSNSPAQMIQSTPDISTPLPPADTIPLTKLTKTQLCERIASRNISQRSSGTLMKMKRDDLITLLESK
jgi:hypothetical protein